MISLDDETCHIFRIRADNKPVTGGLYAFYWPCDWHHLNYNSDNRITVLTDVVYVLDYVGSIITKGAVK